MGVISRKIGRPPHWTEFHHDHHLPQQRVEVREGHAGCNPRRGRNKTRSWDSFGWQERRCKVWPRLGKCNAGLDPLSAAFPPPVISIATSQPTLLGFPC